MTYQYQSGAGGGMSEWLLGTIRQNPEGLLLLAAGAVLLMRKTSSSRSYQTKMPGDFGDEITEMHGSGRDFVQHESGRGFAQQVKDTASSFASSASDYAGQAGRTVGEQSQRIASSAQSTLQSSMNSILQEQPLLVAVAGVAAGAAIAAAFPSTAIERQTLGPIGDQLSDAASRVGGQLQEATAKAGEKLKSAVEERGLNADGLKEVVSDAASAFSDTMSGKKDQTSGTQPSGTQMGARKDQMSGTQMSGNQMGGKKDQMSGNQLSGNQTGNQISGKKDQMGGKKDQGPGSGFDSPSLGQPGSTEKNR